MKKVIMSCLSIICILSLFFTGCQRQSQNEIPLQDIPLLFTPETYPLVDGSTATIPLSEHLAASAMGISLEDARTYILHNTTHNAYVNLIEKKADIIFVTGPSEEEYTLARDAGVEFEIYPIVNEAFVFMVNQTNPVTNLSSEEIIGIYAGKITNWKEVGGEDKEIIAYQRDVNSGSQTGMLDLVMKDVPMTSPPVEEVYHEMSGLVEAIASYKNSDSALGYSYYYYVSSMYQQMGIRLLSIDGIAPTSDTIQAKEYPFATAYYAVLRKDEPEDSPARKLLNFTLAEAGQAAAKEAGYVSIK